MVDDNIENLITKEYHTINANTGIDTVRKELLQRSALVVLDDNMEMLGILTPLDITINPHNLVIDCLSPKPAISLKSTIQNALQIMLDEGSDVLPAYSKGQFEGLVFKNDLIEHLNEQKDAYRKKMDEANNILKDSRKILKAFFDSTQSVIFLLAPDYEILFFNKRAHEFCMKLLRKKCNVGDNFQDHFSKTLPNINPSFKSEFKKALNGEVIINERKMKFSDKTSFWIRSEYDPIYDNKELIGVALTFTNINEQKAYESYIRQQNRTLTAISWIQSHKTRQPLATILGLISIIDKTELSEQNAKVIELLEETASKLDDVIRSTIIKADTVLKDKI